VRAENVLEECRRHLVVLRVRGRGLDRDRRAPERLQQRRSSRLLRRDAAGFLLAQPARHHGANARPQNPVRHDILIDDAIDPRHAGLRGNHGTKTLVVS
jgi:hypothetical protein